MMTYETYRKRFDELSVKHYEIMDRCHGLLKLMKHAQDKQLIAEYSRMLNEIVAEGKKNVKELESLYEEFWGKAVK